MSKIKEHWQEMQELVNELHSEICHFPWYVSIGYSSKEIYLYVSKMSGLKNMSMTDNWKRCKGKKDEYMFYDVPVIVRNVGKIVTVARPKKGSMTKEIEQSIDKKIMDRERLLAFVRIVATGERSDGTYNYCREALEKRAKDLLKELGEND
jgi:hypothetical protein